jgi:epoxyqueuosine reductase
MILKLICKIASHGYRGAVVPISCIKSLKQDIEELREDNYHNKYFDELIKNADNLVPDTLGFEPQSFITVIAPSHKVIIKFTYQNNEIDCVLPPIYAEYGSKETEVLECINTFLEPHGFKALDLMKITDDIFPQKLLASHSGLVKYGRNNICYHEEFGSYIRLLAYVSDMPCEESECFPIGRMKTCDVCQACVVNCPTDSIDKTRKIINAKTCLTSINEYSGSFPDNLSRKAHNCLVGCMRCQDCCPHNKMNNANFIYGVSFTEEETLEILKHKDGESFSDSVRVKLQATGIIRYADLLPRNLSVLLCSSEV